MSGTELTEVSGTGIDVVLNLPKCPVPVLTSYRYRYRHRYGLGYIYGRNMYRAYYSVFHGDTRLVSSLYAVQKVPFGYQLEKKVKNITEGLLELEKDK